MAKRDDKFLEKLLAAFKMEADEHLRSIANGLVELEKCPGGTDAELLETMYREAHSLKGASRSVNMTDIEAVCQAVESVFAALKSARIEPSVEMFDALHLSVDVMGDLMSGDQPEIQPIISQLEDIESGAVGSTFQIAPGPEPPVPSPAPDMETTPDEIEPGSVSAQPAAVVTTVSTETALDESSDSPQNTDRFEQSMPVFKKERPMATQQTETVRIAVGKLDPLLRQVGEMVSVKLTAAQRVSDLNAVMSVIEQWKQKWAGISGHGRSGLGLSGGRTGEHGVGGNGNSAKLADFLEWNMSCMKGLETRLKSLIKSAETDARQHAGMVDDLLEDMMNVLMLPCSSLLEIFPKLVRDLARENGKEVALEIQGADLEIDRRILDEMKDPLIHLVRNCVDHGLELPQERIRKGKPRQGAVTISISQISGNQIELVVSDDGAGIDVGKVKEAARRHGMITDQEKQRIDGLDALSLVFRSEVSTAAVVGSLSGRGLGLAIVREKVENLGGAVSVATSPGMGASFRIHLPVTLATFRGIQVHANDRRFIIPTANVERVARIRKEAVKTVANKDTIEVNGKGIPLVRLADTLELPRAGKKNEDTDYTPVLILRSAETLVAFSVDMVLQEQEVLVKQLGKQLSRVRNVAGATVLGSGLLVPILNVSDLVKTAVKFKGAGGGHPLSLEEAAGAVKSVLVVEDSITSRMLLKNILESSGYQVTTSVDGADAWELLKRETFDLVVSDVEMPRMSGYQLTSAIRSDDRLNELPVILVTSLGSREDRERGIDAGADAYIVKGSFDQNNLLETVERLV